MASNPDSIDMDELREYLESHDITEFKERGDELSFPCPFSGCDDDHRGGEEYHCSFNCAKCQYQCFKCGATGNYITLLQFFGDYDEWNAEHRAKYGSPQKKRKESLESIASNCNKKMHELCRKYYNQRGLTDETIDKFMLGHGDVGVYMQRFTIPVFNRDGKIAYIKLRKQDNDTSDGPKYIIYPSKTKLVLVGEDQLADSTAGDVLICEGELDRIIAIQEGVKMPVITAGGAQVFKDEWITLLKNMRNIYICMDEDEVGEKATSSLAQRLEEAIPKASIFKISLPFDSGTKADLTDYFVQKRGTADELFTKYAQYFAGIKPIDESQFREMSVDDIASVLDLTIKHDYANKVITFLAMLLAYTEDSQLNVMFNAGSSTGKTYICTEISKLFPEQDVKVYGKTSPTAFYYNENLMKKDKETEQSYIDLERRILIFTEQPNTQLLENLRAFLSHDSKRTPFAITNRGKNGKNTATEGYILGFASTFFCTANMRVDEQEQTRSLILSPESTQDKITDAIDISITRGSNKSAYDARLKSNEARKQLMDRIEFIKRLNVGLIDIQDSEYLKARFMEKRRAMQPKTQREIAHFMSLVKGMALINAPFRSVGGKIIATNRDIDEAMKLWNVINESMFFGVSPQVLDIYKTQILPAYYAVNNGRVKDKGITYDEFTKEYYKNTGSYPNVDMFRKMYIPALQCAALISYEKDEDDKRQKLITPLVFFSRDSE